MTTTTTTADPLLELAQSVHAHACELLGFLVSEAEHDDLPGEARLALARALRDARASLVAAETVLEQCGPANVQ